MPPVSLTVAVHSNNSILSLMLLPNTPNSELKAKGQFCLSRSYICSYPCMHRMKSKKVKSLDWPRGDFAISLREADISVG
jgi:hypothetical protein